MTIDCEWSQDLTKFRIWRTFHENNTFELMELDTQEFNQLKDYFQTYWPIEGLTLGQNASQSQLEAH